MRKLSTLLSAISVAIITVVAILSLAKITLAQPPDTHEDGNGTIWILNPLEVDTVQELIDLILNYLLIIATPLASIIIIWAAVLFMTSGGSRDRIDKAKKTLFYALIGIAILLISKGITYTVAEFLTP